MAYVGTLAWARETGGRLGFRDRLTLTGLAAGSLFAELPDLLAYRLGLKRRFPQHVDPAKLKAPDTAAAKAMETLLSELTPAYMVNHSLRTYWFSRLIGIGAGLRFDDEALYLASLAHDLGFYGRYAESTRDSECFTIRSAQAACEIIDRSGGWDPARRDRVAEAVVLNTNGHVPEALGAEAHLMMRGVLVDATGMHAWRVNPQNLREVFAQLPLLDQREQLWPTFRNEACRHPACRGHFAARWLQFGLMVRLSPWK
ncbi:MAG TPA: HD domain-containing protein [Solimonas sp.]|nr:HD domain-containing protein [Solimonas sp.]